MHRMDDASDNKLNIKAIKTDHLHLKAPNNWINDPNGFIYYKGRYHLFYQYFPYAPRWGTMHWGHAVSEDLVTWKHLGIALYPSKQGDQNGCFSGSAVEHDDSLFLLYTGVRYLNVNPEDIHVCLDDQFEACQMLMTSGDGFSFDNERDKQMVIPVLRDSRLGDATDTRDPKVWRGKDAWYMILCTRDENRNGKILIYESRDLARWEVKNACAHHTITGNMGECPDYFEVDGTGVLCYSVFDYIMDGKREPNQLLIMRASFDEETGALSVKGEHRLLDHGMDLYAAQSTTDEAGRRIQISWLRMPVPTEDKWIGQMSTPRVITVQKGYIYTDVHPNVRRQYNIERNHLEINGLLSHYDSCRITASLNDGARLNIFGYQLTYAGDMLITDRSAVFPQAYRDTWRMQHETPVLGGSCAIEIYVEDYMIEVYVNGGQYVITNTVYDLKDYIYEENVDNLHVFTTE